MSRTLRKNLIWATLFAAAMALVEADVVVYLRAMFYPDGFTPPLVLLPKFLTLVELGRELATLVMLFAVAALIGKSGRRQFAWFSLLFGVWDIFYYLWLKVQLGWPETLLDWDILFLIPVPWLGPVLAPILISLALVAGAVIVLLMLEKGTLILQTRTDWLILAAAGFIIILSFTWDFRALLQQQFPERFRWEIFIGGMVVGVGGFVRTVTRKR